MQGSATVSMAAPADQIWDLIADVRNTGKFSPEVLEAEWLDGATGPSLGARFRGHVKRNEIGPVYWTTCRVTACEPGREFGFDVLVGGTPANTWHYRLTPVDAAHRGDRIVPNARQLLHQAVFGAGGPVAPAAQRPRHAHDPRAHQSR